MQLTRAADYAVRVMAHLALLPMGRRATRDELALSGEVPEHFLSKILQALSRGGFITSYRGMAGGFELVRPAESITLLDVVEAMEGPIILNACVAEGPTCTRKNWCAVHLVWLEAQLALTTVLRGVTIAELARDSAENRNKCGGTPWT